MNARVMSGWTIVFYGILCTMIGSCITAAYDGQRNKAIFFAIASVIAAAGWIMSMRRDA